MKYLNSRQLKGLLKVGDILIPGDEELCSFSSSGGIEHVDRILAYAEPADLDGLKILFSVFAFFPESLLRVLFKSFSYSRFLPAPLGAVLRMIDVGIKGIVFTLYYSDFTNNRTIHRRLGWDAKVHYDSNPNSQPSQSC